MSALPLMVYLSNVLVLRIVLWVFSVVVISGQTPVLQQGTKRQPTPTPASRPNPAPDDKIDRPTSEPYTGSLSIFENPKRDDKLQVQRVMDLLAIREGSAVADIGAGSGWFTVRAARRVGSNGLVYAVEINEEYVNHIKSRAEKEALGNVRPILGKEDDPLLSADSVNAILILKTYHEFSQPLKMLRAMHKALRKDGLLGVIDRNGSGDDHGLNRDAVVKEAARAGFELAGEHDFVKPDNMDYFLIFKKAPGR
ncbi:MAG TPA: class I SAM-dependent methyltransferase [Pyrinomonadaceae bacterium]|nr:class I SAM-dependent methyltransferase [Pyrinomonadaceae bacterium]